MDVAADRHWAPHGRDVGLGGEDLAGHVAERLFWREREREKKKKVGFLSVVVVVLVFFFFRRSIAVEERGDRPPQASFSSHYPALPSCTTTHLDLRFRKRAASEQPLDLRVELRARRGVRQGWRGRHSLLSRWPFVRSRSLSRLLSLSPFCSTRGARSPSLSRSFVRGAAVSQERRLESACAPRWCGWPQEKLSRERGPSWKGGRRRWPLMRLCCPPFLSLALACFALLSHA